MTENQHAREVVTGKACSSLIVPSASVDTGEPFLDAVDDGGDGHDGTQQDSIANKGRKRQTTSAIADHTSMRLKRVITWSTWLGATIVAGNVVVIGAYAIMHQSWRSDRSWLMNIAQQHFVAVVGLPFAALAAFAIVTVLETTSGPLEFEGLTFKFKGASGPAVLWIACFLAITVALKALW